MSRKLMMTLASATLLQLTVNAQQALWGGPELKSPEINQDRTVTFRLKAPNAGEVELSADWIPSEMWFIPGSVLMNKDEKGIWTYTTGVLEPELYSYSFIVDGLRIDDPGNPFMKRDVATVTNIFIVAGDPGDLYSVQDVLHGSVTKRWYDSPGLGMDRRMTIYTPPGYETSNESYPVLYLLHGTGGDEEAWTTLGRAAQIMDNLIASGKAAPMIIAMPNGNVTQDAAPEEGSDGFYTPQMFAPKTMEGTFEKTFPDIMNFVETSYRVKADKEHRAIAGLSMGGFHSLHISRYYPDTFDYIGIFSPAILPDQDTSSEVYKDFDSTLKRQMENGYKLYWIGIGKADFVYQSVLAYHEKLEAMGMQHVFVESDGGHIWKNWRIYLTEFVPQLFR
jgi:enterochelin esterase family protein